MTDIHDQADGPDPIGPPPNELDDLPSALEPDAETTTEEPGSILAVLIAAPTPVVTPQPISEATSSGTSLSTFTSAEFGTIISSAKVPQPVMPMIGFPSTTKCGTIIGPMPAHR